MVSVLVVEDDVRVSNFLIDGLKAEGYHVDKCAHGTNAIQKTIMSPSSILIIDRMLPDIDGVSVCSQLRRQGYTGHIMMLTAKDKTDDRIEGLKAGADDYLSKPFDFDELLARLEVFQRREQMSLSDSNSNTIIRGQLEINLDTNVVTYCGNTIDLTKREFELLSFLAMNDNKVLSKVEIISGVWGYNFETETKIVEVYIRYLRKKFEAHCCPISIESVRGFGYQLKI